ncbi:hypothetical protein Tco_0280471 [Tanacetum coccineum]
MNGPYVRRMIPKPGDSDREVPVAETFNEQTDDELSDKEVKQMEADDQAIQTILMGLPEDIYVAVDSCETAEEILLRVQEMMKGESIESYYHHFSKLINDFKRNKHFPEKIASNLKFLSNLQPEWRRHVNMAHQIKDLHEADYPQLYDFLKFNQVEVNELRAERIAKIHDPLALMENSNNHYNCPMFHQDRPSQVNYMQQPQPNHNYIPQPSFNTNYMQQPQPNHKYIPQPSFNTNYMQQPMPNPKDISDPTTAMNMTLVLIAKAFKLDYLNPTNNNQRISSNLHNKQIAQPVHNVRNQVVQNVVQNPGVQNVGNRNELIVVLGIANQNAKQNRNGNFVAARDEGNGNVNNGNQVRCYNYRGMGHLARNCIVRPRRRDVAYLQTQLLIAQKEEARIQL